MLYFMVIMMMSALILPIFTYNDQTVEGGGFVCCGGDIDIEAELLAGNRTVTSEATNKTTGGNLTGIKFLALQHAQSGSISESNATAYSLELNDVSDKTILFSDRPDRIVTSITTSDFIGNWSSGEDSFVQDAPDAVLVVDELQGQETAFIELFNPAYDNEKNTLRYDITPENATTISLPNAFERVTLVIDGSGDYNSGSYNSGNTNTGGF